LLVVTVVLETNAALVGISQFPSLLCYCQFEFEEPVDSVHGQFKDSQPVLIPLIVQKK